MTKKDIVRKLSSRKFWACICGFVTSLMAMLRFSDDTTTAVISLITSAGCLIAYILSEGYIDAAGISGGTVGTETIADVNAQSPIGDAESYAVSETSERGYTRSVEADGGAVRRE